MRKLFIYASIIFITSVGFASCSSDDDDDNGTTKIEYASLPTETKTFLENNLGNATGFTKTDIASIEFEKDGTYEVTYRNGIEIDFYNDGVWKKIDLDDQAIPEGLKALIPAQALAYLDQKYPNYSVDDIEKQSATNTGTANIKIELDNVKSDIIFDYQGNLISDPNNSDFTNNNNNTGNSTIASLPETTQVFLTTYLSNKTNPKVETEYFKYEVKYDEDTDNELELDFYKDGSFMSIDTEENNAGNIQIIKSIITGVTGSTKIYDYISKNHTNTSSYYIEDFSVVSSVAKASYVVKLEGIGKNVDYKLYFDANSNLVLSIID